MGQESIRKLIKRSLQNYAICAKSERGLFQNKSKIINIFLEPFSDRDYDSHFQPPSENPSQTAFQPYPTYACSTTAPFFPDPSTLVDLTPYLPSLEASLSFPLASPFYPSNSSFGNFTPSPIHFHQMPPSNSDWVIPNFQPMASTHRTPT
jgi:hypothetical protein